MLRLILLEMSFPLPLLLHKETFNLSFVIRNANSKCEFQIYWSDHFLSLKIFSSSKKNSVKILIDDLMIHEIKENADNFSGFEFELIGFMFSLQRSKSFIGDFELAITPSEIIRISQNSLPQTSKEFRKSDLIPPVEKNDFRSNLELPLPMFDEEKLIEVLSTGDSHHRKLLQWHTQSQKIEDRNYSPPSDLIMNEVSESQIFGLPIKSQNVHSFNSDKNKSTLPSDVKELDGFLSFDKFLTKTLKHKPDLHFNNVTPERDFINRSVEITETDESVFQRNFKKGTTESGKFEFLRLPVLKDTPENKYPGESSDSESETESFSDKDLLENIFRYLSQPFFSQLQDSEKSSKMTNQSDFSMEEFQYCSDSGMPMMSKFAENITSKRFSNFETSHSDLFPKPFGKTKAMNQNVKAKADRYLSMVTNPEEQHTDLKTWRTYDSSIFPGEEVKK